MPASLCVAAQFAGVSRLADVTGLDVLGVPVWQAVRPWSRTISVSQGKALDGRVAPIAAAMEAIEAHAAESVPCLDHQLCWRDLEPGLRAGLPDDFAKVRGGIGADDRLAWTLAENLLDGAAVWVPHEAVLLDFAREPTALSAVEVHSNGQGAHFSLEGATLKGLLEILERDAEATAFLPDPHFWRLRQVRVARDVWPWFDRIKANADAAGIAIRLYEFPAMAGIRVICCEMREPGAFPAPKALARGVAAGLTAEDALRGAVTEAAQVRVTYVAFAREDLSARLSGRRLAPVPPLDFACVPRLLQADPGTPDETAEQTLGKLLEALCAAGYDQVLRIRLETGHPDVHAVRVFVPGLAANGRARRAPR